MHKSGCVHSTEQRPCTGKSAVDESGCKLDRERQPTSGTAQRIRQRSTRRRTGRAARHGVDARSDRRPGDRRAARERALRASLADYGGFYAVSGRVALAHDTIDAYGKSYVLRRMRSISGVVVR